MDEIKAAHFNFKSAQRIFFQKLLFQSQDCFLKTELKVFLNIFNKNETVDMVVV